MHLLVSELHIYQNVRCSDKNGVNIFVKFQCQTDRHTHAFTGPLNITGNHMYHIILIFRNTEPLPMKRIYLFYVNLGMSCRYFIMRWVRYWILSIIELSSCFKWPIKYRRYTVTYLFIRFLWEIRGLSLLKLTFNYITYTTLAMYNQQMHNISNN